MYDSLGEAYENHGLPEQAAASYQKAVSLGEKNGDVNLPVYKTNLERVSLDQFSSVLVLEIFMGILF